MSPSINYQDAICKKCGQQINKTENFCGHCGAEIRTKDDALSVKTKNCPFCQAEIGFDQEECLNCKRILIEKIPLSRKSTNEIVPKFDSPTNQQNKIKTNYAKLIFNKYILIYYLLLGAILVAWMIFKDDPSGNNGGAKAPLPPPATQISDDSVQLTPSIPAVSLANGTTLKKNSTYFQGYGELEIKNGTSLDALAKLIRGDVSVLTVYIKANSTYTMLDVSDGIYWLAFAQGIDWDSTTQKFRRDTQCSVFEETFDFITTEDSESYQYSTFEVTLNPVTGGTAKTNSVDPQQFDAY